MRKRMDHVRDEQNDSQIRQGESNDCTVRACANALDMHYDNAHELMRLGGRMFRSGMSFMMYMDKKTTLGGCRVNEMDFQSWRRGPKMTLLKFCKKYTEGRYIVIRNGHALAVIDGVIHDNNGNNTPNQWVLRAYKVTLPTPMEEVCSE